MEGGASDCSPSLSKEGGRVVEMEKWLSVKPCEWEKGCPIFGSPNVGRLKELNFNPPGRALGVARCKGT